MKVGGDNNHYSYIADNYNHMTFLCKGKCRRYKQFFYLLLQRCFLTPVLPGSSGKGQKPSVSVSAIGSPSVHLY